MTTRRRARTRSPVALPIETVREPVAYFRVSTPEQEQEGFSIDSQARLLSEYAEQRGVSIVHRFNEAETAKEAGRERFDAMVAFLQKAPHRYAVFAEKTDRLYRNFRDYVTLDDLMQAGLEIHLVKENVVLSKNSRSSEKFIHGIKVLMAKNFIDNLSEETRKGLTEKAEQGMWPSHAPLGYRNSIRDKRKFMEPDPEMAAAVVRTFEAMATGLHSLEDGVRLAKSIGLRFRKSRHALPKSSLHHMLRNPVYMGEFDWAGKRYRGTYEPLVSRELWERVQRVLDRRSDKKLRKAKHDFPFARLIECGHCGCAIVGELKKGRYVYYHCTYAKGKATGTKCPGPYTREEVLEEKFTELLRSLSFDREIVDWVANALRESHDDEKRHHDEAVARLQSEYTRLQNRIDSMYLDKLDGRIEVDFFDKKAAEWRSAQADVLRRIEEHQSANQTYLDEGIRLLELAQRAGTLFEKQSASEKRRLLDFVLSNCSWKDGVLTATFRPPFDIIAGTVANDAAALSAEGAADERSEKWLQLLDSNQRPGG